MLYFYQIDQKDAYMHAEKKKLGPDVENIMDRRAIRRMRREMHDVKWTQIERWQLMMTKSSIITRRS